MAQHDYVIDNQTAPNFRADLNNALSAIVSTNSGSLAPSPTYANMLWYDDDADILRMRNEANDAWINIGTLNQTNNTFTPFVGGSFTTTGTITANAFVGNGAGLTGIEPTTNAVLSATAGASTGAVGTYAWLATDGQGAGAAGVDVPGSQLQYAGAASNGISGNGNIVERSGAVDGTWRRMGFQIGYDNRQKGTLYLRIS
jgi:hypothetical protein